MRKIESIQYLRAIAAIVVVAYHAAFRNDVNFDMGKCGVDIFFVISGFVMWITTHDRKISTAEFLIKRIRRIVPVYWIALVTFYVALKLKPLFFVGVVIKGIWLIKSMIFVPYHNYDQMIMPVLWQGWTLNIEMLFYVIFSLFLWQSTPKYRIAGITFSILGLIAIGYAFKPQNAMLKLYTDSILIEFIFGVWIAWAYTRFTFKNINVVYVVALFATAIAIIIGVMFYKITVENRGFTAGIPTALLILGIIIIDEKGYVPSVNFLRLLGDASYSVYLWHALAMVIVYAFWLRFGFEKGAVAAAVLTFFGVSGGFIAYLLIEKPILTVLNKKLFWKWMT